MNAGGVAAVVDYIGDCRGNVRLPGIMMLGYVAAHSENLAMAVIVSKASMLSLQERNRLSFLCSQLFRVAAGGKTSKQRIVNYDCSGLYHKVESK